MLFSVPQNSLQHASNEKKDIISIHVIIECTHYGQCLFLFKNIFREKTQTILTGLGLPTEYFGNFNFINLGSNFFLHLALKNQ